MTPEAEKGIPGEDVVLTDRIPSILHITVIIVLPSVINAADTAEANVTSVATDPVPQNCAAVASSVVPRVTVHVVPVHPKKSPPAVPTLVAVPAKNNTMKLRRRMTTTTIAQFL